ncbi:hypothetical protein LFM09_34880 [Lentzea alba]|uniref:hypothetical protein n=1 Tax=Lentzea alba TaxID=2714351 RepID=UPI0039BEE0F1
MRRILAVLALVASSFVVAPASADDCSAGVKVVVDFSAFGGGVKTGCYDGDPGNGLVALDDDFDFSFVPRQTGFVCRIDLLPNPCTKPTPSAYWSYWHATPGGTWTYSTSGAAGYDPAPGSVEGWSFGAGTAPGVTP